MGISERKERERALMRQRIIDGAMHMFLHEGYEKTSIRNIADRIEYSPATIYLYYKDKDELLYEVQRIAFDKMVAYFRDQVAATHPLERLREICMAYMTFGKQNPELYDLMFIIKAPMKNLKGDTDWTSGHDAFGYLFSCISECIEQKLIKFNDPLTGALSVWSMGHGLLSLDIRCRIQATGVPQEHVASALHEVILQYLESIKY
ncbi:MAG: TetR/AcrR family transcriptional regulator [Chitinophagia bacterium]|nr:TetR/AcrR family transcriptional regulator [Chitinophagia bacterium]